MSVASYQGLCHLCDNQEVTSCCLACNRALCFICTRAHLKLVTTCTEESQVEMLTVPTMQQNSLLNLEKNLVQQRSKLIQTNADKIKAYEKDKQAVIEICKQAKRWIIQAVDKHFSEQDERIDELDGARVDEEKRLYKKHREQLEKLLRQVRNANTAAVSKTTPTWTITEELIKHYNEFHLKQVAQEQCTFAFDLKTLNVYEFETFLSKDAFAAFLADDAPLRKPLHEDDPSGTGDLSEHEQTGACGYSQHQQTGEGGSIEYEEIEEAQPHRYEYARELAVSLEGPPAELERLIALLCLLCHQFKMVKHRLKKLYRTETGEHQPTDEGVLSLNTRKGKGILAVSRNTREGGTTDAGGPSEQTDAGRPSEQLHESSVLSRMSTASMFNLTRELKQLLEIEKLSFDHADLKRGFNHEALKQSLRTRQQLEQQRSERTEQGMHDDSGMSGPGVLSPCTDMTLDKAGTLLGQFKAAINEDPIRFPPKSAVKEVRLYIAHVQKVVKQCGLAKSNEKSVHKHTGEGGTSTQDHTGSGSFTIDEEVEDYESELIAVGLKLVRNINKYCMLREELSEAEHTASSAGKMEPGQELKLVILGDFKLFCAELNRFKDKTGSRYLLPSKQDHSPTFDKKSARKTRASHQGHGESTTSEQDHGHEGESEASEQDEEIEIMV